MSHNVTPGRKHRGSSSLARSEGRRAATTRSFFVLARLETRDRSEVKWHTMRKSIFRGRRPLCFLVAAPSDGFDREPNGIDIHASLQQTANGHGISSTARPPGRATGFFSIATCLRLSRAHYLIRTASYAFGSKATTSRLDFVESIGCDRWISSRALRTPCFSSPHGASDALRNRRLLCPFSLLITKLLLLSLQPTRLPTVPRNRVASMNSAQRFGGLARSCLTSPRQPLSSLLPTVHGREIRGQGSNQGSNVRFYRCLVSAAIGSSHRDQRHAFDQQTARGLRFSDLFLHFGGRFVIFLTTGSWTRAARVTDCMQNARARATGPRRVARWEIQDEQFPSSNTSHACQVAVTGILRSKPRNSNGSLLKDEPTIASSFSRRGSMLEVKGPTLKRPTCRIRSCASLVTKPPFIFHRRSRLLPRYFVTGLRHSGQSLSLPRAAPVACCPRRKRAYVTQDLNYPRPRAKNIVSTPLRSVARPLL